MADPIDIRPLIPEDAALCLEICRNAISLTGAEHYSRQAVAAWLPDGDVPAWSQRMLGGPDAKGAEAFLAEVEGSPAGFITFTLRGDAATIDLLFVDPGFGRRGVATALINHVITLLGSHQISTCSVDASKPLRPLLTRLGFELVRTQQVPRGDTSLENYHMAHSIPHP